MIYVIINIDLNSLYFHAKYASISVLSCAAHDAQPVRDYGTKDRCEMASSNPGEGSLRLVGGATNNTGVLQVYLSGTWVGICANGIQYDNESLEVECRQLGYRSWYSAGSVSRYNVHYKYYFAINCSNRLFKCIRTHNIVVLNKIILRYIYLYILAVCFAIDVYI